MNWQTFFQDVPDFRLNRRKKHKLLDILVIALCAAVCGADDFEEIEAYGKQKETFLRTFLELPNGIPSHDTFNRVFKFLDKVAFGDCLYRWSKEILADLTVNLPQLCLDGKVQRATARRGKKKSGLCVVSAWVSEHNLVLGQERVDSKSNEKTAIPQLLDSLDLEGSLVSIDAIACQLSNADLIVGKEGHYLLALKKNNKSIHEQVSQRMQAKKASLPTAEHVDFGSGRIERRRCYVENDLALYDDLAGWEHLRSIVMGEASREMGDKVSNETRYYLSDLALAPDVFNGLVRAHWGIENSLHWVLDVVFLEDRQRVRSGNAPDNMATLRKLAMQMLGHMEDKQSTKNKRKMAGWNDEYLVQILDKIKCV